MKIFFFLLLCTFLSAFTIDAAVVHDIADATTENNESEKAVQSSDVKTDGDKDEDDDEKFLSDDEGIPEEEALKVIQKVLEKSKQSDEEDEVFDEDVSDMTDEDDQPKNSIEGAVKKPGKKEKPAGVQSWGRRRRRRRRRRRWSVKRIVSAARRAFCCYKLYHGYYSYSYCCVAGKKK